MFKIIILFGFTISLFANFQSGQNLISKKCNSCHVEYISMDKIKSNFRVHNNKLLNLKAPTFNRIVYKILHGKTQIITNEDDLDLKRITIKGYLKDFLQEPSYDKSLFGKRSAKYFALHKNMKDKLNDKEYNLLVDYVLGYEQNIKKEIAPNKYKKSDTFNEEKILKDAKRLNKKIIVEATSKDCHYCKRMKKDVFSLTEVQSKMRENYIFIEAYVDNKKLPFNLDKKWPKVTPTFFFLSKDGKLKKMYPGSWNKKDYLNLLKENK